MRRLAPAMSAVLALPAVSRYAWQNIASASVLEVKLNSAALFEPDERRARSWAFRMIAVGPATTNAARDRSAEASGGAAGTPDTTDAGGTPPCAGETLDFGAPPPPRSPAHFRAGGRGR